MLQLVVWVAIYALILFGIRKVLDPWRDRFWFKVLFFPGTIITGVVEALTCVPCYGRLGKLSFLGDRKPLCTPPVDKIAIVPGGISVILTSFVLYVLFLVTIGNLSERGALDTHVFALPNIYPTKFIDEQEVRVEFEGCFRNPENWIQNAREHPLTLGMFGYVVFSVFASLGIGGAQVRRVKIVLLVMGAIAYVAGWLGLGFHILTRGFWARIFYVPTWWTEFSLFIGLAFGTFLLATLVRFGPKLAKLCFATEKSGGGGGKSGSGTKKSRHKAIGAKKR